MERQKKYHVSQETEKRNKVLRLNKNEKGLGL